MSEAEAEDSDSRTPAWIYASTTLPLSLSLVGLLLSSCFSSAFHEDT